MDTVLVNKINIIERLAIKDRASIIEVNHAAARGNPFNQRMH